ncbi:MAG: hypothetical protein RIF41_01015, partial [Polyangiaceae bacterium]
MKSTNRARPWLVALAAALLGGAWGPAARAQDSEPVLHEYIAEDSGDAADLGRTDPSGELPASIRTPSGTITPPDVRTTPDPRRVYHNPNGGPGSGFRPDRDTRRPHVEQYDDPFSPTLTPFKRMHAYDAVRDDYTLVVSNESLERVPEGGAASDQDDRFFGDMSVMVRADQPVKIPSVGPGARLVNLVASPD